MYRVLKRYNERVQRVRSKGWRGDGITVKTVEGIAIAIEGSNQMWQIEHTLADVLVEDQSVYGWDDRG